MKDINETLNIYFDGGSIRNPKLAVAVAILKHQDQTGLGLRGSNILKSATRNKATYAGVIMGLEEALNQGYHNIKLYSSNRMVVNQLLGKYQVLPENIIEDYRKAMTLMNQFNDYTIKYLKENERSEVSELIDEVIDEAVEIDMDEKRAIDEILDQLPKEKPRYDYIEEIVKKGDGVRFRDLAKLKVPNGGRDIYSMLNYVDLRYKLPRDVENYFDENCSHMPRKWRLKLYRWYLRGLPVKLAIRKIEVDIEIDENVARKKH
jgi:ribonuclease HI